MAPELHRPSRKRSTPAHLGKDYVLGNKALGTEDAPLDLEEEGKYDDEDYEERVVYHQIGQSDGSEGPPRKKIILPSSIQWSGDQSGATLLVGQQGEQQQVKIVQLKKLVKPVEGEESPQKTPPRTTASIQESPSSFNEGLTGVMSPNSERKRRGRPIGWRKYPDGKPNMITPKRRGRPPGSTNKFSSFTESIGKPTIRKKMKVRIFLVQTYFILRNGLGVLKCCK